MRRLTVVPGRRGGWLVRDVTARRPPSSYGSIEHAEAEARAYLEARGGGEIIVQEGARTISRTLVD